MDNYLLKYMYLHRCITKNLPLVKNKPRLLLSKAIIEKIYISKKIKMVDILLY